MRTTSKSPLAGKRVVITRALQNSELYQKLAACGAILQSLPLISFAPPEDFGPLDQSLTEWDQFDWIIFTSANAVQAVVGRADELGGKSKLANPAPNIAVVGPGTREKAEKSGFSVTYTARTHQGVSLAEELGDRVRDKRVLLPRSDRANPDVPAVLRRFGAHVTEVIAYRTVPTTDADQQALSNIANSEADAILFFSPSAVHTFLELVGREKLKHLQNRVTIASIGHVTAEALREAGVQRIVISAEPTAAAVVEALESHFDAAARQVSSGAKLA